jgi:hypothetical protein
MNIIKDLTDRIEDYRCTNSQPCKNYATEAAAEKATAKMAQDAANYFSANRAQGGSEQAKSARYVVFYVEAWGRWVGCIDLTELLSRKSSTGGYMGFCKGFYTF